MYVCVCTLLDFGHLPFHKAGCLILDKIVSMNK